MTFTHIPAVLKEAAQWVGWRIKERDGEAMKVPFDPVTGEYASVAEPGTLSGFEAAVAFYRAVDDVDGLGFVFTADDPFAGVDLDDCRDPAIGAFADWTVEIIRRLESYTERCPSGTGIHIIVEGAVPTGGNRRGDVEMYDRNRYFTVTGTGARRTSDSATLPRRIRGHPERPDRPTTR